MLNQFKKKCCKIMKVKCKFLDSSILLRIIVGANKYITTI